MREFDMNLLRVVTAIHDEGSVSGAARALGISQPATSAALARLRAVVSDPLFVRTARGMEPTPRAIRLVATAREVLNRVARDVLSEAPFDPATSTVNFTVAMSDIGEMVFLPRLLDHVRTHAPHASIRSVSVPPALLEEGLESGEIDLAVGYFPDLLKNNHFQQRLMTHYFICLLRADHPIRGAKLTMEQFLGLGHAVVRAEGRSQEIFERVLQARGIERKIVLRTPHFMSIPMIIARSDLVVTVPHALGMHFTRYESNVRVVEPPFPIPPIELRQHWHLKFNKDPKVLWLRSTVAALFNDEDDEWRLSMPLVGRSAPKSTAAGRKPARRAPVK